MAQGQVGQRVTNDELQPYLDSLDAFKLPVLFGPNLTLAKGTILGQLTATSANDVQTLTITGTPTGGTLTLNVTNPLTNAQLGLQGAFQAVQPTLLINYNDTNAIIQTAANLVWGVGNVTVTGGVLPGTPIVFTFGGALANTPVALMTVATNALTGGSTPAGAIVHTTTGRMATTYAKFDSTVVTAPTTAPTVAANGAGSTFGAGVYYTGYTVVTAGGESTMSIQAATTLTAGQNLRVSAISSLPNGVTSVNFYVNGMFSASASVTSNATAQTDLTGLSNTYGRPPLVNAAYSQPNGAGCEIAKCILDRALVTDANGGIMYGGQISGGLVGEMQSAASAYFSGAFDTASLVGYNAKALADFGGKEIGTTLAGGKILLIPGT